MADRKITELSAMSAGSQAPGDLLTIVDVSEAAAADKNKKITMENLFKGIPGDVGIGTSPTEKLDVDGKVRITNDIVLAQTNGRFDFDNGNSNGALRFHSTSGNTERMRIDSSGRLLVGTSSSVSAGSNAAAMVQVEHGGGNLTGAFYCTANSTQGGTLVLGHGRGSATGVLQSGDTLGDIRFAGADGTDLVTQGARIAAEADGTPNSNDMPGRIVFSTNPGGSGNSPTERMQIDSSGRVGIGTTSPGVLLDAAGSNPTLRVRATTVNTEVSTLRLTEDNNFVGAYVKYNGSTNLTHIGTHSAADSNTANDNDAISIVRDNRNVGIGTSSPNFKLSVNGEVGITEGQRLSWHDGAGGRSASIFGGSGDILAFTTTSSNAERLRIDSSGNVGIGTSSPTGYIHIEGASTGTETYGRFTTGPANGDQSLVIKSSSSRDHMAIQVSTNAGANDDLSLQPDGGNVGIGVSSPLTKLHLPNNSSIRFGTSGSAAKADIAYSSTGFEFLDIKCQGTTNGFGNIRFYTNSAPTERMRIDSIGRLGLGTSSPGCQTGGIHAVHDASEGTPSFAGAEVAIFQRNFNSSQDCAVSIVSGTNASSTINFGDKDDVNPGIIEYLNGSNAMRFSTNAAERMRILSGGGITFNGDTAQANALDDYEEGDWTPVLQGRTTNGTTTNHRTAKGKYTKIGRFVNIMCDLDATVSGGVGDMMISGLPYTAHSGPHVRFPGSVFFGRMPFSYSDVQITPYVNDGQNQIWLKSSRSNTTSSFISITTNRTEVIINITYMTN